MKNVPNNLIIPVISSFILTKTHLLISQLFLPYMELQSLLQFLQETFACEQGTFSGLMMISLMEIVFEMSD
jgi:hypothetical protein